MISATQFDRLCPRCGQRPQLDNPRGLCARCLLHSFLQDPSTDPATPHGANTAPQPSHSTASIARFDGTDSTTGNTGRYHLREKLGEGGCGVVYLADQFEPVRRQVAFKLLKPGLDSREILRRFETERQVLAVMDHPNIAKILDAGVTETGLPFFVMERVHGVPLTQFCEEHRIPLRARLELVVQVCRALQHAHQKGIIHRDIKPSNILVAFDADQPAPKIIDFGIAKATHGALPDLTLETFVHNFLGSPAYMSPEQAGAQPGGVDTRSDIYSLGVVLYEILTGRTPFDCKAILEQGIADFIATLRDVEPPRPSGCLRSLPQPQLDSISKARGIDPSHLLHSLQGDLDWIVMKCLEKDPARRYETVNSLALDILRHLNHEPILARPPTAVYRLQKMIRRHRAAFWAGAIALSTLIAGFAITTRALIEARSQRNIALREQIRTRSALAHAQIALAEAAYRALDGTAVQSALAAVPHDLRDSTWHYLAAHADSSQATAHGYFIGAAPHPSQPGIFVAAEAGQNIAWIDAATGQRTRQIELTPRQLKGFFHRGLAFSPDGSRLAVGSLAQGGIAIYNAISGELQIEWPAPETDLLQFSPDGTRLLQCSSIENQSILWNVSDGTALWRLTSSIRAVFSHSGAQILASHRTNLVLVNPTTGQIDRHLLTVEKGISHIASHPHRPIAAFGDAEGVIRAMDWQNSRLLYERPAHKGWVRGIAFTADGRRFVSVAEAENQRQSLIVWDSETGARLQSLLGGSSKPEHLCVHPLSDDLLVTGPLTKFWSLAQTPPRWRLGPSSCAVFLPDKSYCLESTGAGIRHLPLLASTSSPSPSWSHSSPGSWRIAVNASAQSPVAAVAQFNNSGGPIYTVRPFTHSLKLHPLGAVTSAVHLVRFSPSGQRVLVFAPGECNGHFDIQTGEILPFLESKPHFRSIHDVAWLSGTRVLGAATLQAARGAPLSEEHLLTWDAHSGNLLQSKRIYSPINVLAFALHNASLADAGDDKTIRLRNAATLELETEFRAHDAPITALAWHPSQPILASASADLTLKLWRLPEARVLHEIRGPAKPVSMISFSADGARIAAANLDATCIWDLAALAPTNAPQR